MSTEAGNLRTTSARDLLDFLRSTVAEFQPDQIINTQGLLNVLSNWENEFASKEIVAKVQQLQREQAQEFHLKVMTLMIEKGSAYANLIIIAGYASFFAITPLVKDLLDPGQRRWSALLMLISLAGFVGFEVFKMLFMQFSMLRRYRQFSLATKLPGFDFLVESALLEKDLNRLQGRFVPVWIFFTTISVLTGLAAVLIPATAFAISILDL